MQNQNLSVDRISKVNHKILFISNGHGEDLIAMRVLDELHALYPNDIYEVLPLVGEGKIFDPAVSENWLEKVGFFKSLPSGGFSNQSLRGLLADLQSGLLANTWKQFQYIYGASKQGRLIIAVGDLFPLFLAWSSGARYGFIGTPKSDYTWMSGPGYAVMDFYHKLKGTEWDPWEYALMKSSRCNFIAVRDKISARGLIRNGVRAFALGNPMMDGLSKKVCPESLKIFDRLILLIGSRMPEALMNFQRLLNALDCLKSKNPLVIFVATGAEPSLGELESYLLIIGYEQDLSSRIDVGQSSVWKRGNFTLLIGPSCFSNWASWAHIGVANAGTATEQLVGLGIPCVSLPGKGPQFKYGFAKRQSRLLGGSVLPCKNSKILAQSVELLLRDKDLRTRLVTCGQKRMGSAGGSYELAKLISKSF